MKVSASLDVNWHIVRHTNLWMSSNNLKLPENNYFQHTWELLNKILGKIWK
jgi:hypothetical protein